MKNTALSSIRSVEALCAHMAQGFQPDFLFFWGHQPTRDGTIASSCMSQWFEAPFVLEGVRYATAEHFMMAEKARIFGDESIRPQILEAPTPAEAKALGRQIRDFDEDTWRAARFDAVVRGNVAKFGQNEALGAFLDRTGDKVLVEASPRDTIWGIGLSAGNERAQHPATWRGINLLGFALMETRDILRGIE